MDSPWEAYKAGQSEPSMAEQMMAVSRPPVSLMDVMSGNTPRGLNRQGNIKLREQMGGDPAFWGPLNQMLFGVPLRPEHSQQQAQEMMRRQMEEAQGVSNSVPRDY